MSKRNPKRRAVYRRKPPTVPERIVQAAVTALSTRLYDCKTIRDLRGRLSAIAAHDEFWEAFEKVASAAKVIGHIDW